MKAVAFKEHGGTDVLKVMDLPVPQIGSHDVLVKVKACALNHVDIWVRQGGVAAYRPELPHITGSDISGVVEKAGGDVKNVCAGDEVVVHPGLTCGRCDYCMAGDDNLCREFKIIGSKIWGGYAEFVRVPEICVFTKPARLSFEDAAAYPLTFLTSWHMLATRAKISAGETVLVHAAGSGVGAAAVCIAKLFGCRVLATAGSDVKVRRAKEIGADDAINYSAKDFQEEVLRLTGGEGVDVVAEHTGQETFSKSVGCLKKNGRLVTCGTTTGPEAKFIIREFFAKQLTFLGSMLGTKSEFLKINRLVSDGKLAPVVDSVFPLEDARRAQEHLLSRQFFGKVVLKVS